MNRKAYIGCIAAHLDGEADFGDELAGVRADRRTADHSMRFLVENEFGKALVATERKRSAAGYPRECTFAVCNTASLRLVLGHTDPRNLGVGISHGRNDARVESAFFTVRDLSRQLAFVRRLMSQHRLPHDVSDSKDVWHVGAHLRIH